jgi:hypothetical protein
MHTDGTSGKARKQQEKQHIRNMAKRLFDDKISTK